MKAIAAMARNRVIGDNGAIPWHLPEDFRWFKRMTLGGVVVMGRKTFESLGKPLPGRRNVVVSQGSRFDGVETLASLSDLNEADYATAPVWIIGGASLYAQTLAVCSDLYLSLVDAEPKGDVMFPQFESQFSLEGVVFEHEGFAVHHYRNINPRINSHE
jgi:dihydrofolate reductase